MIRVEHVTKKFGRAIALDDLGLEVREGECVALWGANGAGKSTLIRCVLGLLRYEGRITVGGIDAARGGKQARRLIGYVPQELGFAEDATTSQALRFYAAIKGVDAPEIAMSLEAVGLEGQERKRLRELSGGMKQRLALALALLGDPRVLILDEVTASLDAAGRSEFIDLLSGMATAGRTLLFASHRQDEVSRLGSRVVVLEKGKVLKECTPRELFTAREATAEATLRLVLDRELSAKAIETLRRTGHRAIANGVGILVPVPPASKAAPFAILADANIPVTDFEFVDPSSPCMALVRDLNSTDDRRGGAQ